MKDDHLHFNHYLSALRSFQAFVCKQNLISSTAHTVRTVHNRKLGLTAFDTKRWLCEDTIHTHFHGHKDTVLEPAYLTTMSIVVEYCTGLASVAAMICLEHPIISYESIRD